MNYGIKNKKTGRFLAVKPSFRIIIFSLKIVAIAYLNFISGNQKKYKNYTVAIIWPWSKIEEYDPI